MSAASPFVRDETKHAAADADERARIRAANSGGEQQSGSAANSETDALARIRAAITADLAAGADAIDAATAPNFVVYPPLPICGASLAGSGGTGKTTLVVNEYIPIVAGGELYGYPVDKQGPCVIVTAEDGANHVRYLQQRVLADGAAAGVFPDSVVRCAKASMPVIDWPRDKYGPLVYVDRDGGFHRADVFELLLELLQPIGAVYVSLDPAVLFSAGERYMNDGDAFFASMIHTAALHLGCCFQVIDHVSQNVSRSGIVDQYAARGSTAKTDNARMARQLVVYKQDDSNMPTARVNLPFAVTAEDISKGRLMQLHWTKRSYMPAIDPVWLLRRGYLIEGKRAPGEEQRQQAQQAAREQQAAYDVGLVVDHVKTQLAVGAGIRLSQNDLEREKIANGDGRPLSRDRIRSALQRALATQQLRRHDLPDGERRGGRKEFLGP